MENKIEKRYSHKNLKWYRPIEKYVFKEKTSKQQTKTKQKKNNKQTKNKKKYVSVKISD